MKVAIISSNRVAIGPNAKKGTEIFVRILINELIKFKDLSITCFAAEGSILPVPIESVFPPTSLDNSIPTEEYVDFELALLAKAFSMQGKFDLFHVNIGSGDLALPLARLIKKPVIITLHHLQNTDYERRYFSLFKDLTNISFVSLSKSQQAIIPAVKRIETIYSGIETDLFTFDATGGKTIHWVGRGIHAKGFDTALDVIKTIEKNMSAFIIHKKEESEWLTSTLKTIDHLGISHLIQTKFDHTRHKLVSEYQKSKLLLFTTRFEEPFGLVTIESMSCGTPVVAFARGALPEIIIDGKTGFLVNPSDSDIRGNYIIKNSGVAGLIEAVEKIYAMPKHQYLQMRRQCRQHVEKHFTAERMAREYKEIYKKLLQ